MTEPTDEKLIEAILAYPCPFHKGQDGWAAWLTLAQRHRPRVYRRMVEEAEFAKGDTSLSPIQNDLRKGLS